MQKVITVKLEDGLLCYIKKVRALIVLILRMGSGQPVTRIKNIYSSHFRYSMSRTLRL